MEVGNDGILLLISILVGIVFRVWSIFDEIGVSIEDKIVVDLIGETKDLERIEHV